MLLANIPVNGYADFMANMFGPTWNVGLNQVSGATFDILAILSVIGIGFAYARNEGLDGVSSGVLALVSFLILTPSTIVTDATVVGGVIPKSWTGGQGVIAAILIGMGLIDISSYKDMIYVTIISSGRLLCQRRLSITQFCVYRQ